MVSKKMVLWVDLKRKLHIIHKAINYHIIHKAINYQPAPPGYLSCRLQEERAGKSKVSFPHHHAWGPNTAI